MLEEGERQVRVGEGRANEIRRERKDFVTMNTIDK